jgi:hypothetical protein
MERVTIYLNEADKGLMICHKCGKSKEMDFLNKKVPRSGVVKCSCGNSFGVLFEKRKQYRKQLDADGTCSSARDLTASTPVRITNVSMGGILLLKTFGEVPQLGETIKVSFPLRNEIISCNVLVCHVDKHYIGAKFINIDEHGKKLLGFFLLP